MHDLKNSAHGPKPELRSLTGLRGVAASTIALAHFQYLLPGNDTKPFMFHSAVDLFFCLSGFTLSYVYRREAFRFSSYLLARIARIYPLYVITLLAAALWVVPLFVKPDTYPTGAAVIDFLRQVAMVNCWPLIGSGVHWNLQSWSISIEWFCYLLLFPALLFSKAPESAPRRLLCMVLLSCFSYWLFAHYFDGELTSPTVYAPKSELSYWVPLVRGMCSFSCGWLAFVSFERRDGLYATSVRFSGLLWGVVVIVSVLAHMRFLNPQSLVLLFPFIVLGATESMSLTSRVLRSRVIYFLGVISYSIYMMHFIVFVGFVALFRTPGNWSEPIYVLLAVTAPAIFVGTYFGIEVPARNAIRRYRQKEVAPVSFA